MSKRMKLWTEVEDFYLTENVVRFSVAELSEKLGRKPEQVAARIAELKLGEKVSAERLKGFSTHPNGAVSMTQRRAFEDDKKEGGVPPSLLPEGDGPPATKENEEFSAKYKNCIHKLS